MVRSRPNDPDPEAWDLYHAFSRHPCDMACLPDPVSRSNQDALMPRHQVWQALEDRRRLKHQQQMAERLLDVIEGAQSG